MCTMHCSINNVVCNVQWIFHKHYFILFAKRSNRFLCHFRVELHRKGMVGNHKMMEGQCRNNNNNYIKQQQCKKWPEKVLRTSVFFFSLCVSFIVAATATVVRTLARLMSAIESKLHERNAPFSLLLFIPVLFCRFLFVFISSNGRRNCLLISYESCTFALEYICMNVIVNAIDLNAITLIQWDRWLREQHFQRLIKRIDRQWQNGKPIANVVCYFASEIKITIIQHQLVCDSE